MDKKNQERLAALAAQNNNRVCHVEVDGKLFVFRRPTLEEWETFQEDLQKRSRGVCFRQFANVTLVSENLEELTAAIEEYPALSFRIADSVSVLAGGTIDVTVKKD